MTNEQQALLEMPLWLVIVLALLGVFLAKCGAPTKLAPAAGRWCGGWRCALGHAWYVGYPP